MSTQASTTLNSKDSSQNNTFKETPIVLANFSNKDQTMTKITNLIENDHVIEITSLLETQMPEHQSIFDLVNSEGFTALHICCHRNSQKSFNALLRAVKEKHSSEPEFQTRLTEWVNAKTTKDEFTAIHYAAYRGNVEMSKLLIEIGADPYSTNSHGLNVLHIATQGDQPASLFFFHKML